MNRITPIEDLVKKAIDEIQTISTEKAAEKINNEEYLFIDIRDIRELWREGKYKMPIMLQEECLNFGLILVLPILKKN